MTSEFMTLHLPIGVIRLGKDMQAGSPVVLTHLTYAPLVDLVDRIEARHAQQAGRDRAAGSNGRTTVARRALGRARNE